MNLMPLINQLRDDYPNRAQKDDVIAVLIAQIAEPAWREIIFKAWCRTRQTSVLRSDLTRLVEAKPKDLQRELFG